MYNGCTNKPDVDVLDSVVETCSSSLSELVSSSLSKSLVDVDSYSYSEEAMCIKY